ncbi:MAG: LPS export ABC transporter periplasmic protein LptC [Pseudomonadota bacterium]
MKQNNSFIYETLRFWFCGAVIFLCIFWLIFSAVRNEDENEKGGKTTFSYHPSSPRIQMGGLVYNLSLEGEAKLTIKADSFRVRKKKVGLIRFALVQEALLENAEINMYGMTPTDDGEEKRSGNHGVALDLPDMPQYLLRAKRLESLVMKPVCYNFHNAQGGVSHLTATRASLNIEDHTVVFEGDVQMISGANVLKTSRLTLLPKEAKIQVSRKFTLNTSKQQMTGMYLVSDVFLKLISL